MAINRVQNALDMRLPKTVTGLKREMAQLKTPQPIGGDVLQVQSLIGEGGPLTISSGQTQGFLATLVPERAVLTLARFAHSIYVDGPPSDATEWHGESNSLTNGQADLLQQAWADYGDSDDTTNTIVYKLYITNNDIASHTYYAEIAFYIPNINQVGF